MKHKTWFRLVIKAIGVLLIAFAIPNLIQAMVSMIGWMRMGGFDAEDWWWGGQIFASLAQAAVGMYLLVGGKWIVNKCIPSNRPYCPECGYDLSKSSGERCPECGVAIERKGATP